MVEYFNVKLQVHRCLLLDDDSSTASLNFLPKNAFMKKTLF